MPYPSSSKGYGSSGNGSGSYTPFSTFNSLYLGRDFGSGAGYGSRNVLPSFTNTSTSYGALGGYGLSSGGLYGNRYGAGGHYSHASKPFSGGLATISEHSSPVSNVTSNMMRRINRPYIPLVSVPVTSTSSSRPHVLDTEDIDVTTPRTEAKPAEINRKRNESFGTIRRDRTVIRLHTKKLKENPYLKNEEQLKALEEQKQKRAAGDKFREKYMIQTKKKKHGEYRRPSLSDIRDQRVQLEKDIGAALEALKANEDDENAKNSILKYQEMLSDVDKKIARRFSKALRKASITALEENEQEFERKLTKIRRASVGLIDLDEMMKDQPPLRLGGSPRLQRKSTKRFTLPADSGHVETELLDNSMMELEMELPDEFEKNILSSRRSTIRRSINLPFGSLNELVETEKECDESTDQILTNAEEKMNDGKSLLRAGTVKRQKSPSPIAETRITPPKSPVTAKNSKLTDQLAKNAQSNNNAMTDGNALENNSLKMAHKINKKKLPNVTKVGKTDTQKVSVERRAPVCDLKAKSNMEIPFDKPDVKIMKVKPNISPATLTANKIVPDNLASTELKTKINVNDIAKPSTSPDGGNKNEKLGQKTSANKPSTLEPKTVPKPTTGKPASQLETKSNLPTQKQGPQFEIPKLKQVQKDPQSERNEKDETLVKQLTPKGKLTQASGKTGIAINSQTTGAHDQSKVSLNENATTLETKVAEISVPSKVGETLAPKNKVVDAIVLNKGVANKRSAQVQPTIPNKEKPPAQVQPILPNKEKLTPQMKPILPNEVKTAIPPIKPILANKEKMTTQTKPIVPNKEKTIAQVQPTKLAEVKEASKEQTKNLEKNSTNNVTKNVKEINEEIKPINEVTAKKDDKISIPILNKVNKTAPLSPKPAATKISDKPTSKIPPVDSSFKSTSSEPLITKEVLATIDHKDKGETPVLKKSEPIVTPKQNKDTIKPEACQEGKQSHVGEKNKPNVLKDVSQDQQKVTSSTTNDAKTKESGSKIPKVSANAAKEGKSSNDHEQLIKEDKITDGSGCADNVPAVEKKCVSTKGGEPRMSSNPSNEYCAVTLSRKGSVRSSMKNYPFQSESEGLKSSNALSDLSKNLSSSSLSDNDDNDWKNKIGEGDNKSLGQLPNATVVTGNRGTSSLSSTSSSSSDDSGCTVVSGM